MATTFSKIVAELIGTTGEISADKLAPGAGGTNWTNAVQTSDFTADNNAGYYVDTTNSIITITLPSSPDTGSVVSVVDVNGTADTNSIIFNAGTNKINGQPYDLEINTQRSGTQVTYSGSTYGWVATETSNDYNAEILAPTNPIVTSIANAAESNRPFFQNDGNTITITGRNFKSDASVTFKGTDESTYTGANVSVASHTSMTVEIPTGMTAAITSSNTLDPFDVIVTNVGDSLSGELSNSLEWLPTPTFTVASGSLGYIYYDNGSITAIAGGNSSSLSTNSYQLDAVSLDTDDSVGNYTVTAGSLPAGISLNSSTGALSGSVTAPAAGSDVSTFTVEATATSGSETKTATREYSIETRGTKVTSVSPTNYDGSAGSTLTLTGRGFSGTGNSEVSNVKLIFTDSGTYPTTTLVKDTDFTVDNDTTITITTPNNITVAQADTGIDIEVELVDGYTYKLSENTSPTLLLAGSVPTMGTPGTITIAAGDRGTSWTAQVPVATDDGSIVSYSATFTPSDGTTDVSGFSINNSGLISATLASDFFAAGGTITAAVTATDNAGNTSSENYTITVDALQTSIYTTEIANSVMFDGSSYLTKSFGSGNRTTWTWSGWVKRGNLGGHQVVFGTQLDGSDIGFISFDNDNKLDLNNKASSSTGVEGNSTKVFRDVGAWYHLVIVYEGNQSNHSDRFSIYVNGESDTFVPRSSISAGNGYINTAVIHGIGFRAQLNSSFLDGYLADIYFIDGQALTPSSFGEYATQGTDVYWIPKEYNPTGNSLTDYGNNGFHLKFDDPTFATYGLGKDSSGRNNHWTPSA
jgi:hypothetical protein